MIVPLVSGRIRVSYKENIAFKKRETSFASVFTTEDIGQIPVPEITFARKLVLGTEEGGGDKR